jgi:hypothetical protein
MDDTTPVDVKRFEIAGLASIALSIPSLLISNWSRAEDATRLTLNEFLASVVISGVVALVLLSASRQRNNKARWLYVALVTISFALTLWMPSLIYEDGVVSAVLYVAQTVLDLSACYFAFTPASRDWFAGVGRAG